MKLSCKQICKLQEFLANLKCPNCFSAKVQLCEEEKEENAECDEADAARYRLSGQKDQMVCAALADGFDGPAGRNEHRAIRGFLLRCLPA